MNIVIATIAEDTRRITFSSTRVISVNGDYAVNCIVFEVPSTYSGWATRVHWVDTSGESRYTTLSTYDLSNRPVWILPSELTQGGDGVIEFSVEFINTNESLGVIARWFTDPARFRNRWTVNGDSEADAETEQEVYDQFAAAVQAIQSAQSDINTAVGAITEAKWLTKYTLLGVPALTSSMLLLGGSDASDAVGYIAYRLGQGGDELSAYVNDTVTSLTAVTISGEAGIVINGDKAITDGNGATNYWEQSGSIWVASDVGVVETWLTENELIVYALISV